MTISSASEKEEKEHAKKLKKIITPKKQGGAFIKLSAFFSSEAGKKLIEREKERSSKVESA